VSRWTLEDVEKIGLDRLVRAQPQRKRKSTIQAKLMSARPSKYHAQPTIVDDIRFDSKREAKRYGELKLREKTGEIWDLEVHPLFPLIVQRQELAGLPAEEVVIGVYEADFKYYELSTIPYVVEDAKGVRTPIYRWKKKHVEAQYGIAVVVV
jgi:hypothetical protein